MTGAKKRRFTLEVNYALYYPVFCLRATASAAARRQRGRQAQWVVRRASMQRERAESLARAARADRPHAHEEAATVTRGERAEGCRPTELDGEAGEAEGQGEVRAR